MTNEAQPSTIENLDSIFTDEPDKAETSEQVEPSGNESDDQKATTEEATGDNTKEENSEDDNSETPAEEERKHVPMSAFMGVKDELKRYKERVKEIEEENGVQDENAPDPIEDPKGYERYIKQKVSGEILQERISTSREKALAGIDDYPEKEELFLFMANKDKSLIDKMNAHPDPAQFAYDTAKQHRDSEREKLRAEIMAELNAKEPEPDKKSNALKVPDLTTATAAGSNATQPKVNRENLDDVFADSQF